MPEATLLSSTAARRHDAKKAATSHPQQPIPPRHGNPWSWEAGKSQTAAGGGQSHRKKAPTEPATAAAKAAAVVADVAAHSESQRFAR